VWLGICFALAKQGPVELRSSSPGEFQAAFGGFGGKGIDLAALDLCFALELRSSSPEGASSRRTANFGGKGIRTPGLLIANETLYQLSYTPARRGH